MWENCFYCLKGLAPWVALALHGLLCFCICLGVQCLVSATNARDSEEDYREIKRAVLQLWFTRYRELKARAYATLVHSICKHTKLFTQSWIYNLPKFENLASSVLSNKGSGEVPPCFYVRVICSVPCNFHSKWMIDEETVLFPGSLLWQVTGDFSVNSGNTS